ncbi:MAG: protein kinase [Gemmataceae bacterium]|nr:protein kinase [Gemmataceae bacterium]
MALENSAASLGTLGNYDLLEKLGEGSMGAVFKAAHWVTKEIVAVKVMPSHVARKPLLLKRFEQEFRIASRVHHPSIVRVLEYSGQGQEPYLVMEFVDGVSLGEQLDRQGRLTEEKALRIIVQVGEGLQHAHELGLLHRDVKPDNILVTADGQAKLTDLGLGKELDAVGELTRTGSGLGTPNFMAPEQFRNAKNADARCDVYSLAATLYQMVTGELPFGHGDPVRIMMRKLNNELTPTRDLAPDLSGRTEQALLRAMEPDPDRRTPTCREFLDDLLGDRPIPALPSATSTGNPQDRPAPGHAPARSSEGIVPEGNGRAGVSASATQRQAPATLPGGSVPTWRLPLTPSAPPPRVAAPPTVAPSAAPPTALTTERLLRDRSTMIARRPVLPLPREPETAGVPKATGSEWWKTGLLIALTAGATVLISQLVFPLFR